MKSQGEIEAIIGEGINRFQQDYMGRGPKRIRTHLWGDLLVIRLHGVLTAAEQQLVKALPSEKGRDLLKQVRTHLIETTRTDTNWMLARVGPIAVPSPDCRSYDRQSAWAHRRSRPTLRISSCRNIHGSDWGWRLLRPDLTMSFGASVLRAD
jgi:uncharacterized protein YbcI